MSKKSEKKLDIKKTSAALKKMFSGRRRPLGPKGYKLSEDRLSLYRALRDAGLTPHRMLPIGSGIWNGLWEDVIIMDKAEKRSLGSITLKTVTHQLCDRAAAIRWNMKRAGKRECDVYPEEFTEEFMKKKREAVKRAKRKDRFFLSIPIEHRGEKMYQMVFSGLNPNTIICGHKVDRKLIKSYCDISKGNQLPYFEFVLNLRHLGLKAVMEQAPHILEIFDKHRLKNTSRRLPLPVPSSPFCEEPMGFSDEECAKLEHELSMDVNTHSNQVILGTENLKELVRGIKKIVRGHKYPRGKVMDGKEGVIIRSFATNENLLRVYSKDKESFVDYSLEAYDLQVVVWDKDTRFIKTGKQKGIAFTP